MKADGADPRPRNWLVPVVLLSLREWNSHGYELMERTAMFGFEAMNPGTLYRTLRRMEEEGVVESSWETSKGGPRCAEHRGQPRSAFAWQTGKRVDDTAYRHGRCRSGPREKLRIAMRRDAPE